MTAFCDTETLEENVKKFPSSFDLDLSNFSKGRVESTIKKLKDDRENTTKSKDEDLKISNFLSYLNFLLGHTDLALQLLDESLQRDPDNIIANTNKGRILLESGEVSDVEEIISHLQDLEKRTDYEKRKCYAEADLAYAYSRSGPWYHQRAVEKFNTLVNIYPTEYAWQFGLGLTLLRRAHNFISLADDIFNPEQHKKNIVRAAGFFLKVAEQSDDNILSAKAYARLGKTVHEIQKNKEWDVPKQIKEIDYISCYKKAAAKCPEEPSVLHICGRLARYARDIDISEKFLRKSIQINPTCQGYHHLALTLKRKVEMGRGQSAETSNIGTRHKSEVKSDTTDSQYLREKTNGRCLSSRGQFHENKYQPTARQYDNHPNSSRHYYQDHYSQHMDQAVYYTGEYGCGDSGYLSYNYEQGNGGYSSTVYENLDCTGAMGGSESLIGNWDNIASRDRTLNGNETFYRNPYCDGYWGNGYFNRGWQGNVNWRGSGNFNRGWQGNVDRRENGNFNRGWQSNVNRRGNGNFSRGNNRSFNRSYSSAGTFNRGRDQNSHRLRIHQNTSYSQEGMQSTGRRSRRRRGSCSETVQTKGQSRENLQVSDQRKQQNLRRLINSPLKVKVYPENTQLLEAIELLEKTKELTEYPLNIEYDKGIIYRMLDQTEQAVRVFKQIVSEKKYLPTQTIMTNVHEQLGLCLLEMSKSEEIDIDLKQKYKKDGQAHLSNAVQFQSGIVADDPEFRNGWNSYPSLKELWNDTTDRKPKKLAVLHMLMGEHRDSIAIYKELSDGKQMDKKDCENMLECYMKVGKYEECATRLSSWECTAIFAELSESLIIDVYINGALHANSMDNAQLAHQRFRRAFQVYGMFGKVDIDPSEAEEEDEAKEILILHSCPQNWRCSYPRDVGTILESCMGLRYTVNTDNVLANEITAEAMVSMMQKIPCIIIMTHGSADHDRFNVNHALKINSKKTGTRVVVLSDDECNVPDVARNVSFIPLPLSDENTIRPDDDHKEWVKQFIENLKPPK
ncbi:uncharacterized protein [Argopecten irradians]|uniref:uncharacterized protein n=1 Tax=Argopecten irradians TaxID=31199 RepID=UPI003723D2EA